MNITIVGCGNVGTQFAVHSAAKGHTVSIFSSKPQDISTKLNIVNAEGELTLSGEMACITNSASKAFSNADLIFVTVPAFAMKCYADKIIPHLKKGSMICLVPGTGGSEFAFKDAVKNGNIIFGLQRVPSVARLVEYGKTVCAMGYRDQLFCASIPSQYANSAAQIITDIFDMPCTAMQNYLNVTLTPSNPILHTTRLSVIFKDYKDGYVYNNVPLFYEEWNDESSELLFKCDNEVQNICKALSTFNLSYVKSLKLHYESETPQQLTKKITSIKSFKGLKSPCVKSNNGYIPDFTSRYFTADFPYGLSILVQISKLLGLACPYMQKTLDWYYSIVPKTQEFSFADYDINVAEALIDFYK